MVRGLLFAVYCGMMYGMTDEMTMEERVALGKALISTKHPELYTYLSRRARAWRTDDSRVEDIISGTIERLLIENSTKPFDNARTLWGRATNICKEEIAQSFASRLPLSGVKFQAHRTATLALQAAQGDPKAAYHMQTGTSRVGRELLFAVAHGPSLYSPEYMQDLNPIDGDNPTELTSHDEDNIRLAITSLSEKEQTVVRNRMWLRMTNKQCAEEMHVSVESVRKTWATALKKLRPVLQASLSERYSDM